MPFFHPVDVISSNVSSDQATQLFVIKIYTVRGSNFPELRKAIRNFSKSFENEGLTSLHER